ncbi:ABC transporter permease [Rhodobacteraceae bacterium NNCM2]|nr:ABC transporter permease [Coraliihabitans acroporae]
MYVLFIAPAVLLLGVLYMLPLLRVLYISATDGDGFVANYSEVLSSGPIQRMLWTTVEICFYTTTITLILSYVIAYVMLRTGPRMRTIMMVCVVVPLWVSVLVRCFAWIAMLYPNGPINGGLEAMGLISQPLELVRNEFGVVVGMVHYMLPFGILPLYSAMGSIDMRVISAARSLGASPRRAFWRVFFPMSLSGVYSAFVIVFIFSVGFYITPAILGGGRVVMIAEYVSLLISQGYDWGVATALSALLLAVVMTTVFLAGRFADWDATLGGRAK